MKVIRLSEDWHGFLALCDSYESAVWYVITNNLIQRDTEFWNDEEKDWNVVYELVKIPTDKNYQLTYADKVQLYDWIIKNINKNHNLWLDWIYFEEEEIETAVPV